jgi:hypothetical protein
LYEPGTFARKATLGWHKQAGNDHLFIDVDNVRALKVVPGKLTVPRTLYFNGDVPDSPNDLLFRWESFEHGYLGRLLLETTGGKPVLRAGTNVLGGNPALDVEERFTVTSLMPDTAADATIWESFAEVDHFHGALFDRTRQGTGADTYREYALLNGNSLQVKKESNIGGVLQNDLTQVSGGSLYLTGKDPLSPEVGTMVLDRSGLHYSAAMGNTVFSQTHLDAAGLSTDTVSAMYVRADSVQAGIVRATDLVTTPKWKIPDYVFEPDYKLRSLEETERFVKEEKHLPEIPSAREIGQRGMSLTEMNVKLLKTVEELTLHVIALDKELKAQKHHNGTLAKEVRALKSVGRRK